ncbi:hypothetical protein CF319_g2710 [Tilletia indica]|nr:hypothetical protein CF319_g2710 [Tilletia indica]
MSEHYHSSTLVCKAATLPSNIEAEMAQSSHASTTLPLDSDHTNTSSRDSLSSVSSSSTSSSFPGDLAPGTNTALGLGISCPLPPPRPGRRRAKVSSTSPNRGTIELMSDEHAQSSASSQFAAPSGRRESSIPPKHFDKNGTLASSRPFDHWGDPFSAPSALQKENSKAVPSFSLSSIWQPKSTDIYEYPSVPIDHTTPYFIRRGDASASIMDQNWESSPHLLPNGMLHLPVVTQSPRLSDGYDEHSSYGRTSSPQSQEISPLLGVRRSSVHSLRHTLSTDFDALSKRDNSTTELRKSLRRMVSNVTLNSLAPASTRLMPTHLSTSSYIYYREPRPSGMEEENEDEVAGNEVKEQKHAAHVQQASLLTPPLDNDAELQGVQSISSLMDGAAQAQASAKSIDNVISCIKSADLHDPSSGRLEGMPLMSPMPPRRPKQKASTSRLRASTSNGAAPAGEVDPSSPTINRIKKGRSSSTPHRCSRPSTSTFGPGGTVWAFGAQPSAEAEGSTSCDLKQVVNALEHQARLGERGSI